MVVVLPPVVVTVYASGVGMCKVSVDPLAVSRVTVVCDGLMYAVVTDPLGPTALGMVVGSTLTVVVPQLEVTTVVVSDGIGTEALPLIDGKLLTDGRELETELETAELETELETAELETELLGTELETQLETAEAAALDETDGLVTTATGETETVDETTDPDESVVCLVTYGVPDPGVTTVVVAPDGVVMV